MAGFTLNDCLAAARNVGFSDASAQTACHLASNESGLGSDTRCACAQYDGGPIYHDAECDQLGLTKHCGILQWSTNNPQWSAVYNNGCIGNLQCELQALFAVTNGGTCFGPWGPDVGQQYGYCTASGVFGGGSPSGANVNTPSTSCDCPPLLFKNGNQCCLAPGGIGCVYSCTQTPSPQITPGGAAGSAAGSAAGAVGGAFGGLLNALVAPFESAGMFLIGIGAIFLGVMLVGRGSGVHITMPQGSMEETAAAA